MPMAPRFTGVPASNQPNVTPELRALMVDLLPTIGSLRDLCAVTGLRLDTVRKETAPFLAIMKLTGTHPKCGCGRDRFHPYGCVDSVAKGPINPVPGHRADQHDAVFSRRAAIIELLVAGERFVDIEDTLGLYKSCAGKYMRFLSPAQVAQREEAVAAKGPQSRVRPGARARRLLAAEARA
jgi:hypothetical protein